MYEVVWTRKLSTIMGSSTYALSTMLAAFMAGLSLGSFIGGRLAGKQKNPEISFALCELGIGLMGLLIIPFIKILTPLFAASYYTFSGSFSSFYIVQFAISFLVMLVPTTLMGMTFPFIMEFKARQEEGAGRLAGYLYCINTIGAVIGSLSAGFFLIPAIGTKMTILTAALLNICIALFILILSRRSKLLAAAAIAALITVGGFLSFHRSSVPFFSYFFAKRFPSPETVERIYEYIDSYADRIVVYKHEGVESDVHLIQMPIKDYGYYLMNNGKLEGGDTPAFSALAYLPFHSRTPGDNPAEILNIGLGSGNTLSQLARFPADQIDSVELSSGIIEANRLFIRPELFSDDRITHIRGDGRNFLLYSQREYDMIVASPSWAVEMASAGMYTDEFFSLVKKRLAEEGSFSIYVDSFVSGNDQCTIYRTFSKNFPFSHVWNVADEGTILTGSKSPFSLTPERILENIARHNADLKGVIGLADSDMKCSAEGPVNTDDLPVVEFNNARQIINFQM
jgi:spermidine synthase